MLPADAVFVVGFANHAIGVEGEGLGKVKYQVFRRGKRDRMAAVQLQQVVFHDGGGKGLDLLQRDRHRVFPAQAQEYRHIGAVAFAGKRQRPVQVDAHPGGEAQHPGGFQFADESFGSPPRAQGVGTGRPHPDLEHVENAYFFHNYKNRTKYNRFSISGEGASNIINRWIMPRPSL